MKKILSISALLLAGCIAANAQFNIHAGYLLNMEKSTIGNQTENETSSGFSIGAGFEYELGSVISIMPEINLDGSFETGTVLNQRVNYRDITLQIPVYAKASWDLGGNLGGYLLLGPEFGVGLSNVMKTGNSVYDYYKDDDYTRFTVGVAGGAGLEFNEKYRLQVTYLYPLTNEYTGSNLVDKTHALRVTIGYLF